MEEVKVKFKMKPRILITGSGGMLGTDLAQELRQGYEVVETDIFRSQRPEDGSQRYFDCDITDRRSVSVLFRKVKPDIAVHTAAWTDVDGCEFDKDRAYSVNFCGTRNVALACREAGAGLIYISTDFVFAGRKKSPYKENDRANPLGVYAGSKLEGELAVKKTLKKYFILRAGWLYGKNGKNFVGNIIGQAKTKKFLRVVDDQVGSPTYTIDLAKAIHKLIDGIITDRKSRVIKYGTYHISNRGSVSWYEYAKTILKFSGIKAKVLPISSEELGKPAKRPAMSVMDNSKFEKMTRHRMRGWKSALREYLG